ncbi:MAG: cation diffusion facilitator family transporter [Desulfurococcaceae archaeon]
MHPVALLFIINLTSAILKIISVTGTTATSVFVDMLNDVGDAVGLGLLLLGLSYERRKSDIVYPYGTRRALYVLSLITISIISGSIFTIALFKVVNVLRAHEGMVVSLQSIYAFMPAFLLNVGGLLVVYLSMRTGNSDPALEGGLLDSMSDVAGSALALSSLILASEFLDIMGSLVLSCVILISAISVGYRYFQVLIGKAPPRQVLRRVLERLLNMGEIRDVNVFNATMITEDEYMLALEVEVDKHLDVEDLERLSGKIEEEVKKIEPRFRHVIVEFVAEKHEPKTYKRLLHEIENSESL